MAWRLREITYLRTATKKGGVAQQTFIRAGIALLYAHWEGFVKQCAKAYVNYVSCRRLRHSELQLCFVALSLRAQMQDIVVTQKASAMVSALETVLCHQESQAKLGKGDLIDRRANLSFSVFADIASWIGVDVQKYEGKLHFIDDRLLVRRNKIAHGRVDPLQLDADAFEGLATGVIELLRWFKTDIENAVYTERFMRTGAQT